MSGANREGKVPVLAILRHEEGVRLDPDALVSLFAELGEAGAERVIRRAMEELAARLSELLKFADAGQRPGMVRSARLMAKVAGQVGLTTMARVASDLARVAEADDRNAQAAVLARLVRIGERSLAAVWDRRDMTV
jgi:hypothetical protein